MNPWLMQLLVGSLGLTLAALLAGLWLRVWRRDPLASYRMAVIVLLVTLGMPIAQWGAKRWDLPKELGVAGEWIQKGVSWASPSAMAQEVPLHRAEATRSGGEVAFLGHVTGQHSFMALGDLKRLNLEAEQADERIAALQMEEQALLGNLAQSLVPGLPWYERQLLGSWDARELALGIYLVGFALALAHTGLRLKRTRELLQDAQPVGDADTLQIWNALMKGSPLAGRVQLLETDRIRVPMCFGLGTPAVVLPPGGRGDLDAELYSCVLLHELVHIERRDTWVMLAQEFARSMFWFHPAAWWLCNRIDLLRELSCDLLVVRRTGRRKRYATALVEYAARMRDEFGPSQAQATALLPWSSSTHQLSRRIEMLVKLSAGKPGTSRRSMFMAAGSLFGMLWGGQLATAAAMTPAQEGKASVVDITDLLDAIELGESVQEEAQGEFEVVHETPTAGNEMLVEEEDQTPKLGITIQQDEGTSRVRILEVSKGSLAERFGLQADDVIVRINGLEASVQGLLKARTSLSKGKLKLGLLRGSTKISVSLNTKGSKQTSHTHTKQERHVHSGHAEGNALFEVHEEALSHAIQLGKAHAEHGNGHSTFESHGNANPLPNQGSTFTIRSRSGDGDSKIIFIDENGEQHELSGSSGTKGNISWIKDDAGQEGHNAHRLYLELNPESVHELPETVHELPETVHELPETVHEQQGQSREWITELRERAPKLFKLKELAKIHDLDMGELQEQFQQAGVHLRNLGVGPGEHFFGSSHGESNPLYLQLGGGGTHEFNLDDLNIPDVKMIIEEAMRRMPDNHNLEHAFKALGKVDHNFFESTRGNLKCDLNFGDGEHPGFLNLDEVFELGADSNFDHGKLKLMLEKAQGLADSGSFKFKWKGGELENALKGTLKGKAHKMKLFMSPKSDSCPECSGSRENPLEGELETEIDRMRALLDERQAELKALQLKLEAMRRRSQ